MAENYVLQELRGSYRRGIYYWADTNYEIDFLIQHHDMVLPIEVKAGGNVRSKSMRKVLEGIDKGVRLSMKNLTENGRLINIPLALAGELPRLITVEGKNRQK